jgi:methionine-rich copper-binding protein CopC
MALFATLVALSFGIVQVVHSHAKLISSEPAADSVLSTSPSEIRMVFSEELVFNTTAQLFGEDGQPIETPPGAIDLNDLDRKTFVLPISTTLPNGTYTVKFTAASIDGHSEDGEFSFSIEAAAAPAPTAEPATAPTAAPEPTALPAPTAASPNTTDGTSPTMVCGIPLGLALFAGVFALRRK